MTLTGVMNYVFCIGLYLPIT